MTTLRKIILAVAAVLALALIVIDSSYGESINSNRDWGVFTLDHGKIEVFSGY